MKRFFVQLSYEGTHYHGWQIQPNAVSVQEVIEEQLSKVMGVKISVVGCGRTDTGVHASEYYLHFDAETIKYTLNELCFKLNNMLPQDISIKKIFEVAPNAHARFDATSREYRYFIHQEKNPFLNPYSWFLSREINVKAMQEAGSMLFNHKDFTSFSKLHTDTKTNLCEIFTFEIIQKPNSVIQIKISANRFLRNMVRSIVGTLVDVGLGKKSLEEFNQIILSKNRAKAGVSAPAKALFLHQINYPPSTFCFDEK